MKHKAHGLIGFAVLLAAALVILGCSDDDPKDDPKVKLAAGSQGKAGNTEITGLSASGVYVLYDGTNWNAIKAGGALVAGDNKSTLVLALADNPAPLGPDKTKITGLDNSKTYNVYIVSVKADGDDRTIAAAENTAGKNMIVDVSAMVTTSKTITFAANTAIAADASVIFVLNGDVSGSDTDVTNNGTPVDAQKITTDAATGKVHTFTAIGTYDSVKVNFSNGSSLVTFTNFAGTTTFVLTQTT